MARVIMIQGTMSNVGKSLITAGLCRIFCQDGYRAAPFKSQNMALNSYITGEGLEIGRAQAVQAAAAGIEPCAAMNPVLLKPCSDTGSQVIVNGIPIGTMPAREYFAYKKKLVPVIKSAFEALAAEYDIIVIEGAGSPAEINLKKDDIVNMGMAMLAKAPVLLVGDIDRGGVFAQLYGTVMLLEEEERALVKGLIINKFRGDPSLLTPGVQMIEELSKVPVVGVVPYMEVDLEEEDSLSSHPAPGTRPKEKGGAHGETGEDTAESFADIAVVRFPRISNYTDFKALSCAEGSRVRYVEKREALGEPDLILLPGTKNTIEDLLWMRQNGLEALVISHALAGKPVFGICGGYQMMGKCLADRSGTESGRPNTVIPGMGLFAEQTEFGETKIRTRVKGHFAETGGLFSALAGMEIEGYEIHMGRTYPLNAAQDGPSPLSRLLEYQDEARKGEKEDGACSGNLYGTYVHGIFDMPGIADGVAAALIRKKGQVFKEKRQNLDYAAYQEAQFEKLAEELRQSLDMKAIYEMMGMAPGREGKE